LLLLLWLWLLWLLLCPDQTGSCLDVPWTLFIL
jgi:hypothetical protein